jgi:hypothetical protein
MLELMSYGLTGLGAVVVLAFCFAYSEEFSPIPGKHSVHAKDKSHRPLSRCSGEKRFGSMNGGVRGESLREEAFHD